MDLTDLNQKDREAKLSHAEALALLRFFNFQRERHGEAPIPEDYNRLCERLSVIYSDVTFKLSEHRVVAQVKRGVSGSLVEHIGFVSSRIPHLTTTVSFDFESIHVVFRADGIGIIKEDSWYEFFEHDLDLEKIRQESEGDKETINDRLHDYFHDVVGPQMEDPFFDPASEDCELYFETGSEAELERLMKLFILTEPGIEAHDDEEVRLYAAVDGADPYLENDDCYCSERLNGLAAVALAENRPVGWTWQYNDGACNRRSGYNECAECLAWNIGEVLEESSARERMAARRELRNYLIARGHDLAQFDELAERKCPA